MVSAVFYVGGSLLFAEAVLLRSGQRLPLGFHGAAFAAIVSAVGYFYYGDQSLILRIYILNFGMAGIYLYAAWRARFLQRGSGIDRAFWWLLLAFAVHFFPRTILTINSVGVTSFGQTAFWGWVQFSMSILGVGMGLALLVVTGADVIIGLRRERDSDPLTGLLNRRGLERRADLMLANGNLAKISVVVCDIDHFKTITDTLGHAVGGAVFSGFAKLGARTARRDVLCDDANHMERLRSWCGGRGGRRGARRW